MSVAAGALSIDVKADMTGFSSQVAAGATAAGQQGARGVTNAFSRVNLGHIGRQMSMGVSLPLVGLGVIATRTAAKFESSMSQTANALGDVNRPMENLENLALELGASTVFSAGEVADAMTELAKGGFTEAEISAGALSTTLDLAAAGGIGLTDAAGMVTASMNTFGIAAKDSAVIADALAGAADASAADVDELAWSLTQVGSLASLANQDLADVTGTLAALADNGIKGSTAGTTIRSVLTTLIKPTEQAAAMMDKYNLQFKDAEGNIKPLPLLAQELADGFKNVSDADRNLALTSIFGTFGLRGAKVLMQEGAKGINEYAAASRNAGAAQRAAAAKMGPTQRALEELSGAWETLMVVLGKGMAPLITKVAQALNKVATALASLPENTRNAVVGFLAVAAAAGPLLMTVSGLMKLRKVASALTAVGAAGKTAGAGMSSASAGFSIPVAGLAKLLTGIGLVVGAWELWGAELDFLKTKFQQITGVGDTFSTALFDGIKQLTPIMGSTMASAEMLNDTFKRFGISFDPGNIIDGLSSANDALNQNKGILAAVTEGWRRLWGGAEVASGALGAAIGRSVDEADAALNRLRSQIAQKKLEIKATSDPAMKAIRMAELAALKIARRTYQLEVKATSAEEARKAIIALDKKVQQLVNRTYKMVIQAEDKEAIAAAKKAQKAIDAVKQKILAAIGADEKPSKDAASKASNAVNSVKQKSPINIDADSSEALEKARAAMQAINAMQATVSIFLEIANPEVANEAKSMATTATRSGPKPTAPASGSVQTPAGPMPSMPRMPDNPYPALSAVYNTWLQQYVMGTAEQVRQAQEAIAAAEIAARRAAEDRVTQFQYQQQDQATAQEKQWAQRQAQADARVTEAQRAAAEKKSANAEKVSNKEAKRIQKERERARNIRNQVQREQTQYQRQQDAQATAMQRQLEDQAAAAEAERQRLEDFWAAVVAANEAAAATAAAVQDAKWALEDTVSGARGGSSESIQQAIDALTLQIHRGQIEAGALGDAYATLAQLAGLRDNAAAQEAADAAAEAAKEAAAVAQAAAEAAQAAAEARQSAWWAREDALESAATASADSIKSQIDQLQKAINRGQVEGGVANTDIAQQTIQELWAIYTRTAATETAKAIQDVAGEAAKALAEHRNSIKDKLDSITWVASPNALLRNLRKRTAIIKEYGANLQALQARGLSKEAMAAINEMDPADAAKLTRKLLANPTLVDELNSAYSTLMDQATDTANIQTAQWVATGQSMTDGILAGLRGGTEAVLSYITTLGADALAALKSVLGIASPSKEFMGVGKDVGLGFVQGVESMESRVLASTARLGALPAVSLPEGSVRGGDGAYSAPTFNVYPQPGQSEVEVARQVSRELAWRMT